MNVVPPAADPFRLEDQRGYARDKLAPRVQEAFRREQTDPGVSQEKGEPGLMAN